MLSVIGDARVFSEVFKLIQQRFMASTIGLCIPLVCVHNSVTGLCRSSWYLVLSSCDISKAKHFSYTDKCRDKTTFLSRLRWKDQHLTVKYQPESPLTLVPTPCSSQINTWCLSRIVRGSPCEPLITIIIWVTFFLGQLFSKYHHYLPTDIMFSVKSRKRVI